MVQPLCRFVQRPYCSFMNVIAGKYTIDFELRHGFEFVTLFMDYGVSTFANKVDFDFC